MSGTSSKTVQKSNSERKYFTTRQPAERKYFTSAAMDKIFLDNLKSKITNLSNSEKTFSKSQEKFYSGWNNTADSDAFLNEATDYYNQIQSIRDSLEDSAYVYKNALGEKGYKELYDSLSSSLKGKDQYLQNISDTKDIYNTYKTAEDFRTAQLQNKYKDLTTFKEYTESPLTRKERLDSSIYPEDEKEYLLKLGYVLEYQEVYDAYKLTEHRLNTLYKSGQRWSYKNKLRDQNLFNTLGKRLKELDSLAAQDGVYKGLNKDIESFTLDYAFNKRWRNLKKTMEEQRNPSEEVKTKELMDKLSGKKEEKEKESKKERPVDGFLDGGYSKYITPEEGEFYWWLKENHPGLARLYYQDLVDVKLKPQHQQEIFNEARDYASKNALTAIGGSLLSVYNNLATGLAFVGNPMVNTTSSFDYLPSRVDARPDWLIKSQGYREGVKDQIDSDVWDYVYDIGMSTAESFAYAGLTAASPVLGRLAIGGSAASSTFYDAINRGVPIGDAYTTAMVSGLAEVVCESISIGQLLKPANIAGGFTKAGIKAAVMNIAKEMLVNFSEEALTEFANITSDYLINGGLSNYSLAVKNYMDQGLSEKEARQKASEDFGKQILEAGVAGGAMGFFFGSIKSFAGMSSSSLLNSRNGGIIKQNGELENLKTFAANSGNTKIQKAAAKLTASSKPSKIGYVYNSLIEEAIDNSTKAMTTEIKKGAKVSTKTAKNWASQMAMSVFDESVDVQSLFTERFKNVSSKKAAQNSSGNITDTAGTTSKSQSSDAAKDVGMAENEQIDNKRLSDVTKKVYTDFASGKYGNSMLVILRDMADTSNRSNKPGVVGYVTPEGNIINENGVEVPMDSYGRAVIGSKQEIEHNINQAINQKDAINNEIRSLHQPTFGTNEIPSSLTQRGPITNIFAQNVADRLESERPNPKRLAAEAKAKAEADAKTKAEAELKAKEKKYLAKEKQITPEQENILKEFGKTKGIEVEFVDGLVNGKGYGVFKNSKKLIMSRRAKKPMRMLFKHEFTHSVEKAKGYAKFQKYILEESRAFNEWLELKGYKNWKHAAYDMMDTYKKNGVDYNKNDTEGDNKVDTEDKNTDNKKDNNFDKAVADVIADFVGDFLFGEGKENLKAIDTNFLVELKRKDRNMFYRFVDWAYSVLKRMVKFNAVDRDIIKLEQKFKRLAEQSVKEREKTEGKQTTTEKAEKTKSQKVEKVAKEQKAEKPKKVDKKSQSYQPQFADVAEEMRTDIEKPKVVVEPKVETTLTKGDDIFTSEGGARETTSTDVLSSNETNHITAKEVKAEILKLKNRRNMYWHNVEQILKKLSLEIELYEKNNDIEGRNKALEEMSLWLSARNKTDAKFENHILELEKRLAEQDQTDEQYSLPSIDRYTEKQYNNFGWVRANDVLTAAEYSTLLSRYADFKHNKDVYPITRFGEAVMHSTEHINVIMYVKGSIKIPEITKVIKINADDYTASKVKEWILQNEYQRVYQPYQSIEFAYGEEIFSKYRQRDFISFQEYRAELERNSSAKSDTASGTEQDGKGSAKQNKETSRADSIDEPAYSLPENSYSVPEIARDKSKEELSAMVKRGEITVDEALDSLTDQHGEMPKGESPKVDVTVPNKVSERQGVRRFPRTALESGHLTDGMSEEAKREILDGALNYKILSNNMLVRMAENEVKNDINKAIKKWEDLVESGRMPTAKEIVLGEVLMVEAAKAGNANDVAMYLAELSAMGTELGQGIQALSLLKKLTGVGQLHYISRVIAQLNRDLTDRYGTKYQNIIELDPYLENILANSKDPSEIESVVDKIITDVASQMPSTWKDKLNAWRYFAMLGNPKTHIRNFFGNVVFMPAIRLHNTLAGIAEKIFIRDKSHRTKSLVLKKEYKNFAEEDFKNVKDLISKGGKMSPSGIVDERRKIFTSKAFAWLEKARQFNFAALEWEDMIFLQHHYKIALASVLQSRGVDLNNITDEQLKSARNYAIKEAQKATYRDFSSVANALNKLAHPDKDSSILAKGFGVLVEGAVPFKKTPINVLKRGIEYSPIGIATSLLNAAIAAKRGEYSGAQLIDGISAGMSGTAILLLGMFLQSIGLISGGLGYDDDDALERMSGAQPYAITLGDVSFTIDWMAPSALPLLVGAEIQKANEEGENLSLWDAVATIGEPMTELSFLQGVNDIIEGVAYSGKDSLGTGGEVATNLASSYLSQYIPTLGGQVARTMDDTRRTNFIDKNSSIPKGIQKVYQKTLGKLPFLSDEKVPYIDAWGRTEKEDSVVLRALENFVSPGYISKVEDDKVNKELAKIYADTEDSGVIPKRAQTSFKVDKNTTKNLTPDEYIQYATNRGQYSRQYVETVMSNSMYRELPSELKAEVIKYLYSFADAKAKGDVSDYDYKENRKFKSAAKFEIAGIDVTSYAIAKVIMGTSNADVDGSDSVDNDEREEALAKAGYSYDEIDEILDIRSSKYEDILEYYSN